MNLIGDPWIPVVLKTGESTEFGLENLFHNLEAINELGVPPAERIALMRFLACIVHAALDGPTDEHAWFRTRDQIVPCSLRYLQAHRNDFELFTDSYFAQLPMLRPAVGKMEKYRFKTSIDKLDPSLAAGHGHTLFDREALDDRVWDVKKIPLKLLVFQNFCLGGGKSASLLWDEIPLDGSINTKANNNFTSGPCAGSLLFTLLQTDNLLTTLWLNLVTRKQLRAVAPEASFGRPIWEEYPSSYKECKSLKFSYLGRLVPLARFLKLSPRRLDRIEYLTNGIQYPSDPRLFREPMSTVIADVKGKQETYLQVDLSRHPWRELSSLLSLTQSPPSGALALGHIETLRANGMAMPLQIWTGGIRTGQAKIEDSAEWIFSFSTEEFGSLQLTVYQDGVDFTEKQNRLLRLATSRYLEELGYSEFKRNERGIYERRDNNSRKHRYMALEKVSREFWGRIDSEYLKLFRIACNKSPSLDDEWKPIVRDSTRKSYRSFCNSSSPRELRAFVKGYCFLCGSGKKGK